MEFPSVPIEDVPVVTTQQMIEVDRLMIETYRIELVQMMENAGRGLARLAVHRFLDDNPEGRSVTVLAGRGGNGGGAIVAARRLHMWGASVRLFVSAAAGDFSGVPQHQLDIVSRIGIPVFEDELPDEDCDLIIDGLIGYSLRGNPRNRAAELIEWANLHQSPILSLDIPSGIDGETGEARRPFVQATATLTLALPKAGLIESDGASRVGELYLADISVPAELYEQLGLKLPYPLFKSSDLIRIHPAAK